MWVGTLSTYVPVFNDSDQCALPLLADRIKQSIASCKVSSSLHLRRCIAESGLASRSLLPFPSRHRGEIRPLTHRAMSEYGRRVRASGLQSWASLLDYWVLWLLIRASQRTFVEAYHASLRLQDNLAQNRIRFSQRLNEMSDELLGLAREGEKLRKLVGFGCIRGTHLICIA